MSDLTLKILIKSVADTTGITLTTEQATKLNDKLQDGVKQSRKFAEETKGTREQLGGLRESGRGAVEMMDGLSRASLGGIQGILGVGQATRGFVNVLRGAIGATGPIGLAVAGMGLLVGAFLAFRRSSDGVVSSQKDFSLALSKSSDAAKELDARRLSNINASIQEGAASAERYYASLKKILELEGKREHAKGEAELAAIAADPNLTELEKAKRSAAVVARLKADDRAREDQGRDIEVNAAQHEAAAKAREADEATARAARKKGRFDNLVDDQLARDARIRQLETIFQTPAAEVDKLPSRSSLTLYSTEAEKALIPLAEEFRALVARNELTNSEKGKRTLADAKSEYEQANADAATKRTAARVAAEALAKVKESVELDRKFAPEIQAAEDAKTATENQAAFKVAADATAAEVARRDALGIIHGLPGERSRRDEELAADRAIELNKRALAEPGRQAGETMAGAVAQAVREIFPTITEAFAAALNQELRGLDDRISREIAQIRSQATVQQNQLKAQRN